MGGIGPDETDILVGLVGHPCRTRASSARRRVRPVAGLNAGGQQFVGDDGAPDPHLAAVLSAYANGRETEQAALGALSRARLLIALVELEAGEDVSPGPAEHGQSGAAEHGQSGAAEHGQSGAAEHSQSGAAEHSQSGAAEHGQSGPAEHSQHEHPARDACAAPPAKEMALPTLIGQDGRPALLAFTSLDALARWRPDARPVPALASQVWGSAVTDSCAVVIDVAGPVPLAVDGARLSALASGEPPPAPQDDPDVHAEVTEALAGVESHRRHRRGPTRPGPDGPEVRHRPRDPADVSARPWCSGRAENSPVQRAAQEIAARLAARLRRAIPGLGGPGARPSPITRADNPRRDPGGVLRLARGCHPEAASTPVVTGPAEVSQDSTDRAVRARAVVHACRSS